MLLSSVPLAVAGCPEDPVDSGGGTGGATGGATGGTTGGATGGSTGGTTGGTSGGLTGGATGGTTGSDCDPGDTYCNGDMLFTCKADGSGVSGVSCPHGCESGQCKTGCVDGPAMCSEDATKRVTCQPNGQPNEEECPHGCVDGACVTQEQVCEPDEILCELGGKKLVKCAPDGLSAETYDVCPYGCEEGDVECNEPACEPADKRCAPDDLLFVEVCMADQTGWQKALEACKEECEEGECKVSLCQPGESKCGPQGVDVCNATQDGFETDELCKAGCLATPAGPQCAACEEGLVQCNGNAVEECANPLDGFVVTDECDDIQTCSGGACLDVVALTGTKNEAILLLMKAFVSCFVTAVEGKCRSIDTTGVSFSISKDEVKAWFCDNKGDESFKAQFDSVDQFDTAQDIVGLCGFIGLPNEQDMDFEVDPIEAGLDATELCLGFSKEGFFSNPNNKEVVVKPCDQF